MSTRRNFLTGIAKAGAASVIAASFNEKGIAHALDSTRFVAGRTPQEVAMDEDFWLEIQRAFTVDRTLINLNNGGVSPSPKVVQEAMRRYRLRYGRDRHHAQRQRVAGKLPARA
jgi:selenocysteine lyase/cysteine desulfurase